MQSLNLGILAHVDAGKTSLTERLLFDAGAIDQLGSVDEGDSQTDTLTVERQRGITVRSAVVSFDIGDISVNLIDTPGHPDFIAEVDRVLRILDGAILVISSVEGVQPQTRVLMRALRRLGIPTLLFVNKIDRDGAQEQSLLRAIVATLGLTIVPMGRTCDLGTRQADFRPSNAEDGEYRATLVETLAAADEQLLIDYIDSDGALGPSRLREQLRAQTWQGMVHPVFFGSARTGAGISCLMAAVADLLPAAAPGDPGATTSGTVFKIERGEAREKIAYVRLFSGTVRIRDRLVYGQDHEDKVTAIATAGRHYHRAPTSVTAGNIAKVWGLGCVQIGDRIGRAGVDQPDQQFAAPMMESVVEARNPSERARLQAALGELAEQDPLIKVRQDGDLDELSVSLYGEIQKEIIQSMLADDYGIEVDFRETTTIHVERPQRSGEAIELLTADTNPYMATIGLRLAPGPAGSGVKFSLDVDERSVPLFIFKSRAAFCDHMRSYVERALSRGLFGWEVTDCVVTVTECDYYVGDGPTKPTAPMARATSADFRGLTPRVVRQALERAGTHVCEPMSRLTIESPSTTIGDLLQAISRRGGVTAQMSVPGQLSTLEARMPVDRLRDLQRRLPGLTGGEGSLEAQFDGYQSVSGEPPTRFPDARVRLR